MKILILMPCDEQHVYAASGIYKALSDEVKDKCFVMPMFMDYLINTKIVGNWIMAFYDALISAKNLCKAADEKNDDVIIIGNAPSAVKFDAVFNFQDIEEDMAYEDKFIEKIKEIVAENEKLIGYVNDLHKAEESKMPLHNCKATGEFLSAYIKTDAKLNLLKEEYEQRLNRKIPDVLES